MYGCLPNGNYYHIEALTKRREEAGMHGAVNKYGLDPAVLNMLYFDAWERRTRSENAQKAACIEAGAKRK